MVLYNWAPYVSASGCTQYGPAGAMALMVYLEDWFPGQVSMGICNCRQVVGGGSYSHHAECRAYDEGHAVSVVGGQIAVATLNLLGPHGSRLGIDHFICNHNPTGAGRGDPRIYSQSAPQGRVYTGTHPHKDHNHIGLTRAAGRNLTYGTLVAVAGAPGGSVPGGSWKEGDVQALRNQVAEAGNKGWLKTAEDVTYWLLAAEDPAHPQWRKNWEPAWSAWKAAEGQAIASGGSAIDQVARDAAKAAAASATSAVSVAGTAKKQADKALSEANRANTRISGIKIPT